MVGVKICGIRRFEDITYLNRHLPNFVGFIFAESKRAVSKEYAKDLSSKLDARIKKVGVFVNQPVEEIIETASFCSLSVVQIHGDEDPSFIEELKSVFKESGLSGVEVWKALRVKDKSSLNKMEEYKVDAFVLDTFSENSYGGSGKTFDWSIAREAKKYGKIIIAGGLTRENVFDAVLTIEPYAVDVSSGVETDGVKDEEKIKLFIKNARSAV